MGEVKKNVTQVTQFSKILHGVITHRAGVT